MNSNMTISGTGAFLCGAGVANVSNTVICLTFIGVGVFLQVMVAYLQQKGLNVQANNLG